MIAKHEYLHNKKIFFAKYSLSHSNIIFRAMREVVIKDPPISFSSNGVIEHVQFQIYNVRPKLVTERFIPNEFVVVG